MPEIKVLSYPNFSYLTFMPGNMIRGKKGRCKIGCILEELGEIKIQVESLRMQDKGNHVTVELQGPTDGGATVRIVYD
ncbi:MAG: hypothetical protein R3B71_03940, partial [Candidatus Gracilibacteria bacterium]